MKLLINFRMKASVSHLAMQAGISANARENAARAAKLKQGV